MTSHTYLLTPKNVPNPYDTERADRPCSSILISSALFKIDITLNVILHGKFT